MKYLGIIIIALSFLIGCAKSEHTIQGIFSEQAMWHQDDSHIFFYDCKVGNEYLYIKENEMPEWELGKTYKVVFKDCGEDRYFNSIVSWEEVIAQPAESPVHKVTIEEITPQ